MKSKKTKYALVKGDLVKCIHSTTTGPGLEPSEDVLTVNRTSGNSFYTDEYPGSYFYMREFEVVLLTKEQLLAQINEIEIAFMAEKDMLMAKLAFLEATGNSVYSMNEFKVWSVLQELKAATDDVTKSKLIAKIIEQD